MSGTVFAQSRSAREPFQTQCLILWRRTIDSARMKVFIGASLAWIAIGTLIGVTLFLLTVKGMIWPFALSLVFVAWLIKAYGCSTH